MRRYIRANTPGATYFFTLTLQDRTAASLVEHIGLLRACVADVKARHPFHIYAMVVLPDHLHALWTLPPDDSNFALRWMLVKRGFTRKLVTFGMLGIEAAARRGSGERTLWQRRYWEHQIRDEDDFARHVEYIHFNPVKHGLVQRAAEWPHSSLHKFICTGKVAPDWGLAVEHAGTFGE